MNLSKNKKPILKNILLSDEIFTEGDPKKIVIKGLFKEILSKKFPAIHKKMSIFLEIVLSDRKKHKLRLSFVDNNDLPIINDFEKEDVLSNEEDFSFVQILNMEDVYFEKEGLYRIKVFVDDDEVGSTSINLKKENVV